MADASSADQQFVADMTAHCAECVATAQAYLKAPPGDRRANLSEMARGMIKQCTADMAQMKMMMSGGSPKM